MPRVVWIFESRQRVSKKNNAHLTKISLHNLALLRQDEGQRSARTDNGSLDARHSLYAQTRSQMTWTVLGRTSTEQMYMQGNTKRRNSKVERLRYGMKYKDSGSGGTPAHRHRQLNHDKKRIPQSGYKIPKTPGPKKPLVPDFDEVLHQKGR